MLEFLRKWLDAPQENIRLNKVIDQLEKEIEDNEKIIVELQTELNASINENVSMQEVFVDTIKGLEAHIETLEPKGTIAVRVIKDGSDDYLWLDREDEIVPHLKVEEIMQDDGLKYVQVDKNILDIFTKMRNHYDTSITITSFYRSEAYNKKIGGADSSRHKVCDAMDIKVQGKTPKQVQNDVKKYYKKWGIGGLGLGATFTHIDARPLNNGKLTIWDY